MSEKYYNKNSKNGSALLIILLAISVLSICTITFWQSSVLFQDVSIVRLAYEQKYRITEAGLNYAIEICSKNFDNFIKELKKESKIGKSNTFTLETDYWKISEHIQYKCKIGIVQNDKSLELNSTLFDINKKKVFKLSCNILKHQNKKKKKVFAIKNWNICDL